MKPSRIFWGALFVVFGALLLIGRNFNVDFGFETLWKFWPIAFILIGLAFIFKEPLVKGILLALAAVGIALCLYGLVSFDWLSPIRLEAGDEGEEGVQVQEFSEPFSPSVKHATLKLEAAAGKYSVDTSGGDLISATVHSSIGGFSLNREASDGAINLHLKPQGHARIVSWKRLVNSAEVHLNPQATWDVNLDIGAAQVECDFSGLQLEKMDVDAGAAKLRLKVGMPVNETHIRIDAGASSIRISVPEAAGCEIRCDGGLSSNKFIEFEKVSDRLYQTADFDKSAKKILIDVDAGLAALRVVRY